MNRPPPALPTDVEHIAAWLHLDYTRDLPLVAVRALLGQWGGPQAVLAATHKQLADITTDHAASALKSHAAPNEQRAERVAKALEWLQDPHYHGTRHILTWDHPAYPQHLLTIADPPLTLFVQGNPAVLAQPCVGMVGARNATAQGIANARVFAQSLADKGVTVVSGMALGIDAAAHEGALLSGADFATVAVIGTGIDRVYPAAHRDLAHRIAAQGAVVSEFPIGTPPLPQNFPRRNRLIAGLSRGVLVVEAALRSGSLITARVAGEQGREVLAIPGSIHAPLSKGCHQLIKQGAKLVESAQDVLEELRLTALPTPQLDLINDDETSPLASLTPPSQDPILDFLTDAPSSLDQIAAATSLPIAHIMARLTELELFGQVALLAGGRYQKQG